MNPLDQLHPLIAPAPVGLWPPAPGWWLLLAVLPLLGWGLWRLRRWRRESGRASCRERV